MSDPFENRHLTCGSLVVADMGLPFLAPPAMLRSAANRLPARRSPQRENGSAECVGQGCSSGCSSPPCRAFQGDQPRTLVQVEPIRTEATRAANAVGACHIRAIRGSDQRPVSVTHPLSPTTEQDRRLRCSQTKRPHRSSKLGVRRVLTATMTATLAARHHPEQSHTVCHARYSRVTCASATPENGRSQPRRNSILPVEEAIQPSRS